MYMHFWTNLCMLPRRLLMTSEDFSNRSFEELLVEEERPTFRRCTAAVVEIGGIGKCPKSWRSLYIYISIYLPPSRKPTFCLFTGIYNVLRPFWDLEFWSQFCRGPYIYIYINTYLHFLGCIYVYPWCVLLTSCLLTRY